MDWAQFLVQAVLFFLVYKLGQWSVLWPIRALFKRMAEERGMEVEDFLQSELKRTGILDEATKEQDTELAAEEQMVIERVDGIYYAYGTDGRFLAQGPDFRAMFENVKQRFPGQDFRIRDYQAQFSDEEAGRLLKAVFDTFGKDQKK
jgi:hypothetical protein